MQSKNPYFRLMRLHQPVGIWLLFWPCAWGLALALPPLAASGLLVVNRLVWPSFLWFLLLFGAGAVAMRGAGCIVNDLWDREFDRAVERTRTRPLASGEISVRQAVALLAALLVLSLGVALLLPHVVFWLALLALPLVVLYPAMKRVTWWPQAFLGLTFNWGALMGWAAMRGAVDAPALFLYAAGFFWTLGYDTIYAMQDRADDAKIGVKSTARLLGMRVPEMIAACYVMVILLLAGALLAVGAKGWLALSLALPGAHLFRQWRQIQNGQCDYGAVFRSNAGAGCSIFFVLLWTAFL